MPLLSLYRKIRIKIKIKRRNKFLGFLFFMVFGKERKRRLKGGME
jgi:hypothetical protein